MTRTRRGVLAALAATIAGCGSRTVADDTVRTERTRTTTHGSQRPTTQGSPTPHTVDSSAIHKRGEWFDLFDSPWQFTTTAVKVVHAGGGAYAVVDVVAMNTGREEAFFPPPHGVDYGIVDSDGEVRTYLAQLADQTPASQLGAIADRNQSRTAMPRRTTPRIGPGESVKQWFAAAVDDAPAPDPDSIVPALIGLEREGILCTWH